MLLLCILLLVLYLLVLDQYLLNSCTLACVKPSFPHVSPDLRNGWKIISPSKSFVVYAATATEKKEWMAHIRKCVNDILASSKLYGGLWTYQTLAESNVLCPNSNLDLNTNFIPDSLAQTWMAILVEK